MAIQNEQTTKHGFVCSDAYTVIERMDYRKDEGKARGYAMTYRDLASRDAGQEPFDRTRIEVIFDTVGTDQMIDLLYGALKTDDKFTNAIDV